MTTTITIRQIDQAKAEGRFRYAGQLDALRGGDGHYGAHFGMRSTCEAAREEFRAGFEEVNHYLTRGDTSTRKIDQRITKYIVRSMTTTDHNGRDPIVPYHVYLVPSAERFGAYWGSVYRAQLFNSPQEAEAEIARSLPGDDRAQVAPLDSDAPTYWEVQELNAAHRKTKRARVAAI